MTDEQTRAWNKTRIENLRLRRALQSIAGFGSVNLNSEWDGGLRDIIRSMTGCALDALKSAEYGEKP